MRLMFETQGQHECVGCDGLGGGEDRQTRVERSRTPSQSSFWTDRTYSFLSWFATDKRAPVGDGRVMLFMSAGDPLTCI